MLDVSKEKAREEALKFFNGDELATDAFLRKYAMTNKKGNYIETTPEHMWRRMAKAAAAIEKNPGEWEEKFYNIMTDFKAVPQGSIMFALGNDQQKSSCSNCFVFDVEDNLESIFEAGKEMARTYSYRGGCGLDISPLRPQSATVTNAAKSSSGAASFMEFYSDITRMIGMHGRRGALMLTIGVDHPDIELFTTMKHDKTKVTGANVSIRITDAFMNAVKKDKKWVAEFKTRHETIKKEWMAKDLWDIIVKSATEYAEPGLLFWDNILKESPADLYADQGFKTICTNPCSELPLSRYDSCTLLSMNLSRYTHKDFTDEAYFDKESFLADTIVATRFLDNVKTIDADLVPLDQQKEISRKGRRIGMGIHGLADTMANLKIRYDSKEGVQWIDHLFELYTKRVYQTSADLATEKGAFEIFDAKREKGHPFLERIGFAGVPRRNIACMTLAPTGTVSMISQTSSGIEPVFRVNYTRRRKINHSEMPSGAHKLFIDDMGDRWEEYPVYHQNAERYLRVTGEEKLPEYFVSSDEIDWEKRVEIQAAITKWLDHSASSTVNLPKGTTIETVGKIYMKAWESGCKGMTVYVDGCRDGVLITDEDGGQDQLVDTPRVKRPNKIPCDMYQIQADGSKWFVVVGLVHGRPYEVFCGKQGNKVELDHKTERGYIEREGRGKYSLHIKEDVILKDISTLFTDTQGAITRLISTSLRHGVNMKFIVQQLEKSDGTLTSFSKAISRVLKKYIKDGTTENGAECSECKQPTLVREEGCVKCVTCGWSKCN